MPGLHDLHFFQGKQIAGLHDLHCQDDVAGFGAV